MSLKFDKDVYMPDDVVGYIDFEFAELKTDWKSTWGYIFMLARAAISHSSKLHSIVELSTYEAEYVAIYEAGKEAVW